MTKIEKNLLDWCEKNIIPILIVILSILGIVIRYSFRDVLSHDAMGYLLPWFETRKSLGGLKGLNVQVGDYNLVYQFFIALMTYIPVEPLYQYKILSCVFDYSLAAGVAVLVYDLVRAQSGNQAQESTQKAALNSAVIAYGLILFSMTVVMNSAAWAQCDGIYSSFVIWSLVFLLREKYPRAFIFLGLAFSFKLQAIFIVPFFLFVYFWRRRYSILHFVLVPVVMVLTCIPNMVAGRTILDVFKVYLSQAGSYGQLWLKYPSFWTIFPDIPFGDDPIFPDFHRYKNMITFSVVAFLAILMLITLYRKVAPTFKNQLYIAFLLTYIAVLFLPCMHERYGYLYEVLAIVLIFANRRMLLPAVPVQLIVLYQYGGCLGVETLPMNMQQLSLINVFTFLAYCIMIFRDMEPAAESETVDAGKTKADINNNVIGIIRGIYNKIFEIEKFLLSWLDDHKEILAIFVLSIFGLAARFFLRKVEPAGIIQGIEIFDRLLLGSLCKYVSAAADYVMGVCAGLLVCHSIQDKKRKLQLFTLTYIVVIFSPLVLLDSMAAGWGNSIYTALVLFALVLMVEASHYTVGFIVVGIACMLNPKMLLLVPFLVFLYLYERKFSIFNFAIIAVLSAGGFVLSGKGNFTSEYLYHMYPSFWAFKDESDTLHVTSAWIVLVLAVGVVIWLLLKHKKSQAEGDQAKARGDILMTCFLLVYVAAVFMPGADQKDAYICAILAFIMAFRNSRMIIPAAILQVMALYLYTAGFYYSYIMPFSVAGFAWINVITAICCVGCFCGLSRKPIGLIEPGKSDKMNH